MATPRLPSKLASKPVNMQFASELEVLDTKVYDLPGAVGERQARDPRLNSYVGATMPQGNTVCFYEHMTTLRHRPTGTFYVVFRETKDAQLMQQSDPVKYPKWLMDHAVKDDERSLYVHMVKPEAVGKKGFRSIDEWLVPIQNTLTFDTLAYFLVRSGLWTEKMYGSYL